MAFKMKGTEFYGTSPLTKKTDEEKANKLVEKREKLREKKKKREEKGRKTKGIDRRLDRVQDKINENPAVQRWAEEDDDTPTPVMTDKKYDTPGQKKTNWPKGEGTGYKIPYTK
jgi:pyruvate/2-oxoglutarate dehydrogenase complex dihydrolipoamide acyltransferase (E2) component